MPLGEFARAVKSRSLSFAVLASVMLAATIFSPTNADAYTLVTDTQLPTTTVWTKSGSPYIVAQQVATAQGSTFTIEPGTVVKFTLGGDISVNGSFKAIGAPDDPIVFTSVRDDDWGGDTDNFAYLTPPVTASTTVLSADDRGGYLGLHLSNGSPIVRYVWASDAQGGRAGGGYLGETELLVGDPPIPFDSNIEIVAFGPDIMGQCTLGADTYTGNIAYDFGCLLSQAQVNNVPVVKYASPLPAAASDYTFALGFESSSTAEISNAIFRYGGGKQCYSGCADHGMVESRGGSVNIMNSDFSDGFAGVKIDIGPYVAGQMHISGSSFKRLNNAVYTLEGTVSVRRSSFSPDVIYGANSSWGGSIDEEDDWWGDAAGPQWGSNERLASTSALAYWGATVDSWLSAPPEVGASSTESWAFGDQPAFDIAAGQSDSTTSTTDSSTSTSATTTPNDIHYPNRPAIIIPGILGSLPSIGGWVLDPVMHTYDGLVNAFLANGYTLGSTLFEFPYDWRKSVSDTAALLKAEIAKAKDACHCSRVDLVAHSLGGLVARAYMASSDYGNDVARVAFIGVPHRGAPTDYLMWEGGRVGSTLQDFLMQVVLTVFAKTQGYRDVFDYVRHYPVDPVRTLLPIYDYLKASPTSTPKTYPTDYPTNSFLSDLNDALPVLLASSSPTAVYNIAGDTGANTMSAIVVGPRKSTTKWRYGEPAGYEYGEGDGTVPTSSASLGSGFDVFLQATHTDLPTAASEIVIHSLSGFAPVPSLAAAHPKKLLSVVSSALDGISRSLLLVSPSGQKTGTDRSTGETVNDIPGAYYLADQGGSSAVIVPDPEDGDYTVETWSSEPGGYEVDVQTATEGTSTEHGIDTTEQTFTATSTQDTGSDIAFGLSGSSTTDLKETATYGSVQDDTASSTSVGSTQTDTSSAAPVTVSADINHAYRSGGRRSTGGGGSGSEAPISHPAPISSSMPADAMIDMGMSADEFARIYLTADAAVERVSNEPVVGAARETSVVAGEEGDRSGERAGSVAQLASPAASGGGLLAVISRIISRAWRFVSSLF